tara:strand:+ start:221 stop:394 length:174 start_codon:yes stop_codon:yes gene_type:complete
MNNTLTIQEEVDKCLEEIALNEEGYFDPDNDEETKQYYRDEQFYWINRLHQLYSQKN